MGTCTSHSHVAPAPLTKYLSPGQHSSRGVALASASLATPAGGSSTTIGAAAHITHAAPHHQNAGHASPQATVSPPATQVDPVHRFTVAAWSHDAANVLRMLLSSPPRIRAHLFQFLRAEFNDDHAAFFADVERLKLDAHGDDTWAAAQSIYNRYLQPGASYEVNLSYRLKRAPFTPSDHIAILSAAQDEVLQLLAADSFPRFLRSPYCDAMLEELLRAHEEAPQDLHAPVAAPAKPSVGSTLLAFLQRMRASPSHTDSSSSGSFETGRQSWLEMFKAAAELLPECIVITDMMRPGVPIVFANTAFYATTQFRPEHVLGRNCRFLQGEGTSQVDVEHIRTAIRTGEQVSIRILNYKRDGTPFMNFLSLKPVFMAPHADERTITAGLPTTYDVTADVDVNSGGKTPRPGAPPPRKLAYFIGMQFEMTEDAALVPAKLIKHAALLRMLPSEVVVTPSHI